MLGVKAFGIPQKQQLLLFKKIVVAHPRFGSTKLQAELDYLESHELIKRIDIKSLLNATSDHKVDETLVNAECSRLVATECNLFGGETSSDMVRGIFNRYLEDNAKTRPGYEIAVDNPGNDTYYNDLTRLITSTIRHVLKLDSVGLLVEDRTLDPNYKGYRSRMAHTPSRRELPKSLQPFLAESVRNRGQTSAAHTQARDWLEHNAPPLEVTPRRMRRVFDTVLQKIPIPDESTPYQDIIEFRQDPETKERFQLFQYWIRDAICSERSVSEISEELEWLTEQYSKNLMRHRIKYGVGVLRVAMSFGAQFAEDALKFRLKSLVDIPFQIADLRSKMSDADVTIPGHQISYIQLAHKNFRV